MFLDNDWFNWFLSSYSICLTFIPVILTFFVKLVAIFHPRVPSDRIVDLIHEYWK